MKLSNAGAIARGLDHGRSAQERQFSNVGTNDTLRRKGPADFQRRGGRAEFPCHHTKATDMKCPDCGEPMDGLHKGSCSWWNTKATEQAVPMKHCYMGEDIETLPRERLIEIIVELARDLESTRTMAISSTRLMADLARAWR